MPFYRYIFACFIWCSLLVLAQQNCSWSNGSDVRPFQAYWVNFYPIQASSCCLNGDVCLSEILCYGPGNRMQWRCGNETETMACEGGSHASSSYTSGQVLGFPPLKPSPSTPTKSSNHLVTTVSSASAEPSAKSIFISASSPVYTSRGPSAAAQTQKQSTPMPTESPTRGQTQNHPTSLPTAIEVGIGVPLGLAVIGLFGFLFLFWRKMTRQRKVEPRTPSQGPVPEKENRSAAISIYGQWTELPDAQLPREIDGRGRAELSSV